MAAKFMQLVIITLSIYPYLVLSQEFAWALMKKAVERGLAGGGSEPAPAKDGFAASTDPCAQTAFWRSLTSVERAEILGAG